MQRLFSRGLAGEGEVRKEDLHYHLRPSLLDGEMQMADVCPVCPTFSSAYLIVEAREIRVSL